MAKCYFMLSDQRFGSGSVPTHLIGATLFRGEWKSAVSMILDPREGDILLLIACSTSPNKKIKKCKHKKLIACLLYYELLPTIPILRVRYPLRYPLACCFLTSDISSTR